MIRGIALFAAATLALGLGTAAAQDYTLPPINGAIKLNAGFTPDPYTVDVQAGGDIDAGAAISCPGFVSAAPSLRLFYTAGDAPLRFSVLSDTDTTLIINDPDGNWNCNDDTNGINPEVAFDVPLEGQYDIWVGTYSSGGTITATLEISGAVGVALNYELDPIYGEIELKSGFTPDPQVFDIDAGGPVNVEDTPGTDGMCWGYATAAPTLRLQYEAGDFPLYIYALAEADTVLIINDPNGEWHCADDTGDGNDPVVTFDTPIAGQYDIWVGTYGGGDPTPATLYISEVTAGPGPEEGVGGLNWDLDPLFGAANLATGFGFQEIAIDAGGTIDPFDLGEGCVGFVTEAPTYRIFYDGNAPLLFNVAGGTDTTLVIADPDGQWFCNDDANGTLDPELAFDGYAGQYDIWVGTFAGDGTTAPATLTITEGEGATPTAQLDWALEPIFGTQTLEAGFLPDPFAVTVDAGGEIDANLALGDDNCWGFVTAEPTFRLNYTAGTYPLAFWVEAAEDVDTTLIISDPNGDWFCSDDDAGGWNPGLLFEAALTGQYDIWVGNYDGGVAPATLYVSETTNPIAGFDSPPIVSEPPPPPSLPPPSIPVPLGALEPTGIPLFGEVNLNAGFSPDPTTVDVMAGGPVQGVVAAEACSGYVSAEPTVRLTYAAAAWPLILSAVSEADTTIIVRAPDGTFLCDDDTNGANPVVRIEQPVAGTYEIWVGTYSPGPTQAATLFISEISGGP